MDLAKELVLLKQEFEKRAARIESKDSLESIELGIISFHQLITAIEKLSLNDHYHQSLNVGKDEVHPLDGQVTKSEQAKPSQANGAVADKYNYALLVLEGMKLFFFEHRDEMEIARDTLLKNGKRLQYYKKDKNGYWIKPDVYK